MEPSRNSSTLWTTIPVAKMRGGQRRRCEGWAWLQAQPNPRRRAASDSGSHSRTNRGALMFSNRREQSRFFIWRDIVPQGYETRAVLRRLQLALPDRGAEAHIGT